MESLLLAEVEQYQRIMKIISQCTDKLAAYTKEGKESFTGLYEETREELNRLKASVEKDPVKQSSIDEVKSSARKISYFWFKIAVVKKSAEILEYLFSRGEKLDFEEPDDCTPLLQLAVETKDLKKVELLLKHGADVNVEQTNPVELRQLAYNPYNRPIPFKKGTTVLHRAVVAMQEEMVRLLLDHGADISKADVGNDTAMHHAAYMGNLKIVELLYSRGAFIDGTDGYDFSSLDYAIDRNHKQVFQFLFDRLTDNRDSLINQALLVAARKGTLEIVKILLDAGANENVIDVRNESETPLFYAAERGHLEVVKLLLDRGAEIDRANDDSDTPLHAAIGQNELPMIQLLLKHGANVNSENTSGQTCLHTAAQLGFLDIIELLLDNQADIFAKDVLGGQTALSLALEGEYADELKTIDTCKYLVRWMIGMQLDTSPCKDELNKINSDPLFKDVKNYLVECEKEISLVKNEEIQATSVHYYDVIDKLSLSELIKLSRNENITEAFELNNLIAKFPIFASMLYKPYQRAVERRRLLDKARRVFCSLYDSNDQKHPTLPYLFTDRVFEYLSMEDLTNLTDKFA